MPFPTTKSDPWKRGVSVRPTSRLWPEAVWKKLEELCADDATTHIGPRVLAEIARINLAMYGKP